MPGYWDATDTYLREHGGKGPTCSACGREKFPIDDHGRFGCFCNGVGLAGELGMRNTARQIPQVDVSGMTDAQKAEVPPLNRLDAPPTAAEGAFLKALITGAADDDPVGYDVAREALDKERRHE